MSMISTLISHILSLPVDEQNEIISTLIEEVKLYQQTKKCNKDELARKGKFKKGDVVTVFFGAPLTTEIAKVRPAIVIENDNPVMHGNVVVVPITSKPPARHGVRLNADFLKKESYANVQAIRCVAKSRIGYKIGKLPRNTVQEIEEEIRKMLL